MNRLIYLDDTRIPETDEYTDRPRTYSEFRSLLEKIVQAGDKIEFANFDYYLGEAKDPNFPYPYKTGMDCIELMIQMDKDHAILIDDFMWDVHSSDHTYNMRMYHAVNDYISSKKVMA